MLPVLSAFLLAGYARAQAPIVGANFEGRPNQTVGYSDVAGQFPQGHWNNIREEATGFVGTSGPLTDYAGNATPITLEFVANDAWNNDGGTGTPDERLMKGVIKAFGPAGTMHLDTFTLHNVPAGTYTLVLYCNVNGDGVQVDFAAGGITNTIIEQHSFPGSYTRAVSINPLVRDTGNTCSLTVCRPMEVVTSSSP